ncbi:MAG: polysaccharide deacetylase family protein [Candidatus Omnitrophota bacterium]
MKATIIKKIIFRLFIFIAAAVFCFAVFTVFVDQALFVRHGTFYRAKTGEKVIALTFDDGPSPKWTNLILDELKDAGVKATFFMIGKHVEQYPEVARRIVAEGHDVGVHTYNHPVLLFSPTWHLEKELNDTQAVIKEITGKTTYLFRPPKAWLSAKEKAEIARLGYTTVLWSLNSKDWVRFDDKHIRNYIYKNARPGDIVLFHDAGGAFRIEGGNRKQTTKTLPRLIEKLKEKGYRFVTVSELLEMSAGH